ncbi:hypothetical protein D3C87_64640 [compost metagenome]
MEENTHESFFKSSSLPKRLFGLNYHLIQSERGQRKKIYEFLLGLPLFILVGIFFLSGRNTDTNTFKLEQFAICGLSFLSIYGLTRLSLKFTSDKMKSFMDVFEKQEDRALRKILIRYSLIYYGFSFLVILILSVFY